MSWREAAANAARLTSGAEDAPEKDTKPRPAVAYERSSLKLHVPAASSSQPLQIPPPPAAKLPSRPSMTHALTVEKQKLTIPTPGLPRPHAKPNKLDSGFASLSSIEAIHWSKLPEHFPVASKSLYTLPSGKPKPIPKIQYAFKAEDAASKADRLVKLDKIRDVFKKSWTGYREHAWLHDELKPVSGKFRDPFANWGATLVDTLDTLWIMGLKAEFEEAVKAVDQIDFTTTQRADIPLFETTIRYLGGLLAAYDISGRKYQNLLDKAVQLAELLISAFDTPNRMPETYYYWRPLFASQKHRASNRLVLAEIGSLSLEFTRLAQLTGVHKYYDAIARITDNLEEFQNNTRLPGMWPIFLDGSGCGKVPMDLSLQEPLRAPENSFENPLTDGARAEVLSPIEPLSPEGEKYVPLHLPDPIILTNEPPPKDENDAILSSSGKDKTLNANGDPLDKRQLDVDHHEPPKMPPDADKVSLVETVVPTPLECVPQGFVSSSDYGTEAYTLGGMSDSTYEYLPKEYLLLGGKVEKYRTMYERSTDVVKKHLIFRPMLPNEEDILFCGKLTVPSLNEDEPEVGDLEGENAHLTCFAGGMLGMGAKLFDRPEDLEIAKKLTEGCVWSYNMTATGIMPEAFNTLPCKSTEKCAWNETAYWEVLDSQSEFRLQNYQDQLRLYKKQLASASSWYEAQLAAMTTPPTPSINIIPKVQATPTPIYVDAPDRRQLAEQEDNTDNTDTPTKVQPISNIEDDISMPSLTMPVFPMLYSPPPPMSHEDYVQNRIQEERLPRGVTNIRSRSYILRYVFFMPEDICSADFAKGLKQSSPFGTCTASPVIRTGVKPAGVCSVPLMSTRPPSTVTPPLTT